MRPIDPTDKVKANFRAYSACYLVLYQKLYFAGDRSSKLQQMSEAYQRLCQLFTEHIKRDYPATYSYQLIKEYAGLINYHAYFLKIEHPYFNKQFTDHSQRSSDFIAAYKNYLQEQLATHTKARNATRKQYSHKL